MSDGQLKVSQLQSLTEPDADIRIENQYNLNHRMQMNDSRCAFRHLPPEVSGLQHFREVVTGEVRALYRRSTAYCAYPP